MSAEFKVIGTVKVVTDHDCGLYRLGEVEASFDKQELRDLIKAHGPRDLLMALCFLQHQVMEAIREVSTDQGPSACENVKCK